MNVSCDCLKPGNGSGYVRHVDFDITRVNGNTDNDSVVGRKLTLILYLNENWSTEDGGSLRIYSNRSGRDSDSDSDIDSDINYDYVDISPKIGTLVMFRRYALCKATDNIPR
jgi:2OG-Fe(II) oxygenase superfamily